ncbi:hypothetical protein E4U41_001045 [Claviceps citrina]|nr:hypothetical protein E4U41_001045 [Claviceps citrina]
MSHAAAVFLPDQSGSHKESLSPFDGDGSDASGLQLAMSSCDGGAVYSAVPRPADKVDDDASSIPDTTPRLDDMSSHAEQRLAKMAGGKGQRSKGRCNKKMDEDEESFSLESAADSSREKSSHSSHGDESHRRRGAGWTPSEDLVLRGIKASKDNLSWAHIGQSLNRSKKEVKARWKAIRDESDGESSDEPACLNRDDCATLATIASRYERSRLLEMQANFLNAAGWMIPISHLRPRLLSARQRRGEATDEQNKAAGVNEWIRQVRGE